MKFPKFSRKIEFILLGMTLVQFFVTYALTSMGGMGASAVFLFCLLIFNILTISFYGDYAVFYVAVYSFLAASTSVGWGGPPIMAYGFVFLLPTVLAYLICKFMLKR